MFLRRGAINVSLENCANQKGESVKEDAIQRAVIWWCRNREIFRLAFHVNNEGKKTVRQAGLDKARGILAGIPDICIPIRGGRTIWLELKNETGRLSAAQKEMHEHLEQRGHRVYVAHGFDEAIEILQGIEKNSCSKGNCHWNYEGTCAFAEEGCEYGEKPVESQSAGSVSFSIEEIRHYLEGLCLVGEHRENDMLNCAISLLDDYEDGIEAVLERRKQND